MCIRNVKQTCVGGKGKMPPQNRHYSQGEGEEGVNRFFMSGLEGWERPTSNNCGAWGTADELGGVKVAGIGENVECPDPTHRSTAGSRDQMARN